MINTNNKIISIAQQQLESGNAKNALAVLREYIRTNPNDSQAYVFLSRVCAELSLFDEALTFLKEAERLAPGFDYREEWGMLFYRKDSYKEAYARFSQKGIENVTNAEVLTAYAECAARIGDHTAAHRALKKARSVHPERADILCKLAQLSDSLPKMSQTAEKKKIAVFASNDFFLHDIIKHWENQHEVKVFNGSQFNEASALTRWSDIVWLEWCDQLTTAVSKLPKHSPIICRLHRYEAFTDMPRTMHWANIDHLVCVADIVKKHLLSRFAGQISVPISIIPNGVDFRKFTIPQDKKYGKRVAYVGYLRKIKGLELLIQCFKKIQDYDPEYTFHIAGTFIEPDAEPYVMHMINKLHLPVVFNGWIENIPEWLRDKDYIISTSIFESFMYALVEGIGCGLMPMVHWWPGADDIYPEECLFLTVDNCVDLLRRYEGSDRRAEAERLRAIMVERFALEKQLESIDRVIEKYLHL